MRNKLLKLFPLLFALILSGCGTFGEQVDESEFWSASELYSHAKDMVAKSDYEKAVMYYEKLEARYPFGVLAQQAQMEIAYAHYLNNDQQQALAAIDRFIKLHPSHPNVDYMYYLRGLVNFNDRKSILSFLTIEDPAERDPKAAQNAFDAFNVLVTKFPESKYTPDAKSRMEFLVNAMAQNEVVVARYYFKRGAYLAAANRAQYALKNFPETPANEEALYIMVQAYDKMGMTDLRDDAERVFKKNFPESEFTSGKVEEDPWWKIFW